MAKLRYAALSLALLLLLQLSVSAVDSIPGFEEGLQGRRFLVLGDSYTAGYGLDSPEQDWTYVMADTWGMTQLNYSISGSSFAAGDHGYFPMVERCQELPEDDTLDFIILQGGSNDWANGIPLGQDTDRQADTFCGALNLILDTLTEKYPNATLVGFTPWISDDSKNSQGYTAQDYTAAMLRICDSRDILCYDASNTVENGMYLNSEAFRSKYCLSSRDWYHLNPEGHAMFAPIIAKWLEEHLYSIVPADQFYDLATASEDLRTAVSSLVPAGILSGTGSHLFSPTRAASREALALTLYRMAGSPDAPALSLTDVAPETESYRAVCWAMDTGIFSVSDTFSPGQSVTREMLATVMYRYYTEVLEAYPDALAGLGSYADGNDVSDYARVSMGWAISAGILTETDGLLKPQSTVSRGQLAISLYALWTLSRR